MTLNFIIVAAVPLIAVGLVGIQSLSASMEDEIKEKNLLLSKSVAGELESFLREPLNLLGHIKDVISRQAMVPRDELDDYLSLLVSRYRFFDVILILDESGRIRNLGPFDRNSLGLDMSNQQYYKIVREKKAPYWSQTFIAPQTGRPTLTLSVPLEQGMLVGYLNLKDMGSITDKVNLGFHGYITVVDNDGTVIAHRDKKFVSERYNLKSISPIRIGVLGREGTFRYVFQNASEIGSVAVINMTGWVVMVSQSVEQAFAPVRRVRNIVLAGILVALILAVLTGLMSLRKTLRPLSRLTEDAQRIAGGNYTFKARPASYTEIDNLGDSFSVMQQAVKTRENELKRHRDHLEELVRERTVELEDAKEAAEMASRSKSEFLANMSHELRTPLNAILGFSEILEHLIEDPKQKKYFSRIQVSGRALLDMVNDILDLSKIEAGKLRLEFMAVSLEHLFSEVRGLFFHKAAEKGVAIETVISPNLPEYLILDEIRIRQILLNLISNAVKFTERGTVTLSAGCDFSEGETSDVTLILAVEDTGIGLAPEECENVFDAFWQSSRRKGKQVGGTGLGLAITNRLTKMMGGNISISSRLGEGSRFVVTIPNVEIAAGTQEHVGKEDIVCDAVVFEKATVLIVDDIDYNRELLQGYYEPYDLEIIEAENGIQAMEMTRKHKPDLIVLDMKMPEMDGYEVMAILREDPILSNIPVLAVTASALKKDIERIEALCQGYLCKPVTRSDFIRATMELLPHSIRDTTGAEQPRKIIEVSDTAHNVSSCPAELLNVLRSAAGAADIDRLNDLIDELEKYDSLAAALLRKHAERYEYNDIRNLLSAWEGKSE